MGKITKRQAALLVAACLMLPAIVAWPCVAHADIFQWEYIDPNNPDFGKRPSTTLAPDGAGANAAPAADLSHRNLTKAYLIDADLSPIPVFDDEGTLIYTLVAGLIGTNLTQADLSGADLRLARLENADFSHANLSNADFWLADLTGANLMDADVRGAYFHGNPDTDITASQLYSTASYRTHDLSGVKLVANNLASINLAGQTLTRAFFGSSTLTEANLYGALADRTNFGYANLAGANFCHTTLSNAYFYAADLTGANLSQADLTNADFYSAALNNTNLAGAIVRGASFLRDTGSFPSSSGITRAQLYSTASYQNRDLSGIKVGNNNLAGINLAGQNLTNADFSGLALCDENGCSLFPGTDLTNATLVGADVRGASLQDAILNGANGSNLIQPNGHIAGLDLNPSMSLVVRDYDGNPEVSPPMGPLPIVIDQHLAMSGTGALELVFEQDAWDSTISFALGIPVALGGTLDLSFAPEVNLASQIGRAINLFDWSGVNPTGAFVVNSPHFWDLSKLYTTGEVTLLAIGLGDFNDDGAYTCADVDSLVASIVSGTNPAVFDLTYDGLVNIEDLDAWRAEAGAVNLGPDRAYLPGDGNLNGVVDGSDFGIWNAHTFTGVAAWCSGDFSADGTVDGSDFGIWNAYKFTGSNASAVPEPTGLAFILLGLILIAAASIRCKLRRAILTTVVGTVACCAATAEAGTYSILDLGTLGGTESYAYGVNESGQVVGYSYMTGDTALHAFRTSANSSITAASDLGVQSGGSQSFGVALNNLGEAVGSSDVTTNIYARQAFRTGANGPITAGSGLGSLGGGFSQPRGINESGQVVGTSTVEGTSVVNYRAFRTNPNGQITPESDLGSLGGTISEANAINDSGQVVGYSYTAGNVVPRAFRTVANGSITAASDLGTLGGNSSSAYGINANGQVVGDSITADGVNHAFRTEANGSITPASDLGTLHGLSYSYAFGINASGTAVGYCSGPDGTFPDRIAFVADSSGQMHDLNTLIPSASGWVLYQANAINDLGQIAGFGAIDGQIHAFLLTPVPEPSGVLILAIAFPFLRRFQGGTGNGSPRHPHFAENPCRRT